MYKYKEERDSRDKTSLRDPKQARWGNNSRFERSFVPGIREIQWRGFLRCWISRNSSDGRLSWWSHNFYFPQEKRNFNTYINVSNVIRSSEFYTRVSITRNNETHNCEEKYSRYTDIITTNDANKIKEILLEEKKKTKAKRTPQESSLHRLL